MDNMKKLIDQISKRSDCVINPAMGLPQLSENHVLPEELSEFYKLAGGAVLFQDSEQPYTILSPEEFQQSDIAIAGEVNEDSISSNWYVIVMDGNGDYLNINCAKEKTGYCYDTYHELYAMEGRTAIIATSFSELLTQLLANNGESSYWLKDDFVTLGDAYDL